MPKVSLQHAVSRSFTTLDAVSLDGKNLYCSDGYRYDLVTWRLMPGLVRGAYVGARARHDVALTDPDGDLILADAENVFYGKVTKKVDGETVYIDRLALNINDWDFFPNHHVSTFQTRYVQRFGCLIHVVTRFQCADYVYPSVEAAIADELKFRTPDPICKPHGICVSRMPSVFDYEVNTNIMTGFIQTYNKLWVYFTANFAQLLIFENAGAAAQASMHLQIYTGMKTFQVTEVFSFESKIEYPGLNI